MQCSLHPTTMPQSQTRALLLKWQPQCPVRNPSRHCHVAPCAGRTPFGNSQTGLVTICTAACRSWQFTSGSLRWGTFSNQKEHSKIALVRVGPVGAGATVSGPGAMFYLCVGDINYERGAQTKRYGRSILWSRGSVSLFSR